MATIQDFIRTKTLLGPGATIGEMIQHPRTCIDQLLIDEGTLVPVSTIAQGTISPVGGGIDGSFASTEANDLYAVATTLSGGEAYAGDRFYLGFEYANPVRNQPVIDRWGVLQDHYHDEGFGNDPPAALLSTRADGFGQALDIGSNSGWDITNGGVYNNRYFSFTNGFNFSWAMGSAIPTNAGTSYPWYILTNVGAFGFRVSQFSSTTRILLTGFSQVPVGLEGLITIKYTEGFPYTNGGNGSVSWHNVSFDPSTRIIRYEVRNPSASGYVLDFKEGDLTGLTAPWENPSITGDGFYFAGVSTTDMGVADEYIYMDRYLNEVERQQLFDAWQDPAAETTSTQNEFNTVVEAQGTINQGSTTSEGTINVGTITPAGTIDPEV